MSLHVSDHALLRYFERVGGVDVEAVRRALSERLSPAAEKAEEIKPGIFAIKFNGAHFIVKNRVIVSVLQNHHVMDLKS